MVTLEGVKLAWYFSSYYHGNALYTRTSKPSPALCTALKVDGSVYESPTCKDCRSKPLKRVLRGGEGLLMQENSSSVKDPENLLQLQWELLKKSSPR